ncbi:Holliday junction resolvase [Ectothiorhodospira haloalkaliphila]|uniref:Putative pre-16S rRNA nuclease n=1 Tax=Ectothiorhodospira haloalkaliphila TaxID=421628 RepID=W8KM59_9GAMM|nr:MULTISPECIES: Holliday junction resolvase RuvX [Ectothiorhodospira]AHK80248.1 Holliday junction resolvase [Ectothiorhodospira haloalkaliphila]MCG5494593.1 Holliday junction resolvase RuvX [Ectothiorhodospira variabilis]MCG5496175.1 Holliday junction resolvase RuvX [Ectothiorhodospira variabilis]MCG5503584.1 Holliday junction resolvase RuvX [Ectothiorhodospira variabilis]MCG5506701.1 Holliday junction resolvase RuvX [Ectothiorhodospira variabilis]
MPEQRSKPANTGPATSGTVLGLDYGERRIGVAVGNGLTGTSAPLETLPARNGIPEWPRLDTLVREWQPQLLVVGLPETDDGTEHPLARRIQAFSDRLRARYGLKVRPVDEQFTSAEAESHLKDWRREGRRGRIRKEDIDAVAAAVLLEHWLSQETSHD